jgi:hypothetical protein
MMQQLPVGEAVLITGPGRCIDSAPVRPLWIVRAAAEQTTTEGA